MEIGIKGLHHVLPSRKACQFWQGGGKRGWRENESGTIEKYFEKVVLQINFVIIKQYKPLIPKNIYHLIHYLS